MKEACPTQRRDDAHVFGSGCRLFVQAQVWDRRELYGTIVFECIRLYLTGFACSMTEYHWVVLIRVLFCLRQSFRCLRPRPKGQWWSGRDRQNSIHFHFSDITIFQLEGLISHDARILATFCLVFNRHRGTARYFFTLYYYLINYIYLIVLAWQLKESRWEYAHAVHCQEGSEMKLEAFSHVFAVQSDLVKYQTSFNFLVLVL